MANSSRPPESTAVAATLAIAPPADLEPNELTVWEREAPLAIAERTLTAATAGAFREFCELQALKNTMFKQIKVRLVGVEVSESGVFEKAHPLLTHYRGAVQRLAAFRKDFKLAPFGKEILAAGDRQLTAPANPLERFLNRKR